MLNDNDLIQYTGQRLLERGFQCFFRFFFKKIEGRPFIIEPIHQDLFDTFQKIYDLECLRQIINIPPRSAKTTMAKYFIAYCLAQNPRCNFIYTSFSQTLLSGIAEELKGILEHPIYKTMYVESVSSEDVEEKPLDDFWKQYALKTYGKASYSNKLIRTASGGVILFASVGSAITGMGAGIRGSKKFSGCLIMDDLQKPIEVHSEVMRNKTNRYFEETLLSRLNDSNVPIINIQQRLHVEDLSGYLIDNYKFNLLRKPLIVNGVCQIPSQYDEKRLHEIQVNSYLFSSQYQQEPILDGGEMIKKDWILYYPVEAKFNYTRIFMTMDTASKIEEANDYTVMACWGIYNGKLHLLDVIRGKWQALELINQVIAFWNRWKQLSQYKVCDCVYIEDKNSGTMLIQSLQAKTGLPVVSYIPDGSKYNRLLPCLPYIEAGGLYLPNNENYGINKDLINEMIAFRMDMTHSHDDFVDNLTMAIIMGISKLNVSTFEVL